ncbi:hypothetical protein [Hahella sp. HN01]|uniref:hypothetical protein n=1 Tax=Hahella sp. HN01 TaxID=2847262 RepID=UPI001C1F0FFA|nr:hypothetical protein [Hahella sp. HN01]MBU6953255.1 hypothetical protein [Hahella sp. HN01]
MSVDWSQIEIFKGIDLNDSFVLNWDQDGDSLVFDLDASIWPESEYYSKPVEGEYACYRKATLIFTNVKNISGLRNIESVIPTIDPDGSIDYGEIETFCLTSSGFKLSGDFGLVTIQGGEFTFEIHT